jgi:hypothetical protein
VVVREEIRKKKSYISCPFGYFILKRGKEGGEGWRRQERCFLLCAYERGCGLMRGVSAGIGGDVDTDQDEDEDEDNDKDKDRRERKERVWVLQPRRY